MRARFVEGLARSIRGWLSGDQAGYQGEWDGRLGADTRRCEGLQFLLIHVSVAAHKPKREYRAMTASAPADEFETDK